MPHIHPTLVVQDWWEVPLIWPMSWEMRIETIELPMDASCIAVLSMSKMGYIQQLDLGSSPVEVFTSKLTSG